ncbi:MAG: ABC transporter permease [Candidatus Acidiferrales bacterium]
MLNDLLIRVRALFRRDAVEIELDDELRFHFEQQIDKFAKSGHSPAESRRRARLIIGGSDQIKEECREARGTRLFDSFAQDVRYALRTLRKSPGFTIVAVLTLALGIGANTAIFSVVQGVLLARLPFSEPDSLVLVWQNNLTLKHMISDSYPDFLDWQRNARSFRQLAAFDWQERDLTSPGTPEHLSGKLISSGFFATLGVEPTLGREFSPREDKHDGAPVVIISNRLWRNRFAGSTGVLGKSVTLDGIDYTIVGVLPAAFRLFGDEADVYTPLGQGDPLIYPDRTIHPVICIARLRPGVTLAQSDAEMGAVQDRLDQLYPAADRGLGANVTPLKQEFVGNVRGTLLLLFGAVGIVLLIACANVANLLLARSAARTREFAIRSALGAIRRRIVSQLLTESVLLSFLGGGLGLVVAKLALNSILAAVPGSLPRSENIGINVYVLLFVFSVSITVGILFGLTPALKSSKTDLQTALKEGVPSSTAAHHRAQGSLVVIQVALTLVILVGAGLLLRTIRTLWDVNPGFDTQNLVTFRVGLSPSAAKTPSGMRSAYQQLIERIRNIPSVNAADLTVLVPLAQGQNIGPFWVGSQAPISSAQAPRALFYWTGPDYLRTMKITLLRGRYFTPEDTVKSEPVVVIDSVLARSYFSDRDPVGQAMTIPHWGPVRVIGVVDHVRHWGLGARDTYTENQIYASLYQLSDDWAPVFYRRVTVVVRAPLDSATVIPAIKAAVYAAGRDQPVYRIQTMRKIAADSMSSQRFPMILLAAFAGLALLLASVGIYGVISYSVSQRVHEIGIRMALGAERRAIFSMVIGQGLRLVLIGLAIGAASALILTRLLTSFSHLLYGVGGSDPITFASVSVLLIGVAAWACYVPARRATKVDPMVALRYE